jgi:CBS domain-containing protein
MEKKDLLTNIHSACAVGMNLIPPTLLCDSIGSIGLKTPLVVKPETTLAECVDVLQHHKIGSLLVVDEQGKLVGIFTERDCILKVMAKVQSLNEAVVKDYMTPHPIRERAEASIAFALNLMSHGGFRHVPIVDQDDVPIGIVSVKDVVDHIVRKMLEAIYEAVEES